MSKEKAIAKYETETKMAKVGTAISTVVCVIGPLVAFGWGFGLFLAVVGAGFTGMIYSMKPNKKDRVPLLDIGTLVYHNPIIGSENNTHRLYEMSVNMDYTKLLPVWTVVYHNENSYVIECNGNKHEVSYRAQDNLIPILSAPKAVELKGTKT